MEENFMPYSKTVLQLFEGSTAYQVPIYQRPYSWDSEQIEELWDDIFTAFESDEPEYFLGSIILTRNKEGKYLDVIDGQQRLTTLMILFCVLRDLYYKDHQDLTKRNRVLGRIKNIEDGRERLKFITQYQNQNEFEEEIIKNINYNKNERDLKKNKFFNTAYIFRDKIEIELLKNKDSKKIEDFTEYLLEKVRVVTIECANQSSAIKLFQVLNNRGMDLTPADLIKSYLMGELKSDEDNNTFNSTWIAIENKAKELEEDLTKLFTYYEYYLLASNPKRSLYEELEKQFKKVDSKTVIFEFHKLVKIFDEIVNEKSKAIYALDYLRHDVYWKSILVSARLKEWNKNDFSKLTEELRRFYYLYWLADYTTSRTKQTSFNIIAWIKENKGIGYITDNLNKKIAEDKVVGRVLKNLRANDVYNTAWVKPLLVLIEYQQTDESNINYIDLDKALHVEHILPQSYAKIPYWSERFSHESADKLVNSLGNLTLLSGKKNISASNNPFPDKLQTYVGKGKDGITGFRLTQKISDDTKSDSEWTEERIRSRYSWILGRLGSLFVLDFNQDIPEDDEQYDEEEIINESTEELYNLLKEAVLKFWQGVNIENKKHYIAFKKGINNFMSVKLQSNRIKIWLRSEKLVDLRKIAKDVSSKGHHGTGQYELILSSKDDIDYVLSLVKQAYENLPAMERYVLSDILEKVDDQATIERINSLRRKIVSISEDIEEYCTRDHINFRSRIQFCRIYPQKKQFWVDFKLNKEKLVNHSLDIRPHRNSEWANVRVANNVDLELLVPLIKEAYKKSLEEKNQTDEDL